MTFNITINKLDSDALNQVIDEGFINILCIDDAQTPLEKLISTVDYSEERQIPLADLPEGLAAFSEKMSQIFAELNEDSDMDEDERWTPQEYWCTNPDRTIWAWVSRDPEAPFNPSGYAFFIKKNKKDVWSLFGQTEI